MSSASHRSTTRRGFVLAALAAALPVAESFHSSPMMLRMVSNNNDHTSARPKPEAVSAEACSRRLFLGSTAASLLVPSLANAQEAPAKVESKADNFKKGGSLEKTLAAVAFTKKIDEATEKAFKLAKKGNLKGAVQQWNIVIDVYENGNDDVVVTPQATYRLGKSLGERGNVLAELGKQAKNRDFLELATKDYVKALKFVPSEDTRIKLATAYSALGDYKNAEAVFGEVLGRGDPGNEVKGRAYTNRGIARREQGNIEGAAEDFEKAVEATRGSPEPVANLALVKYQLGDSKAAIDMLVAQVKSNPLGLSTIEGAEDIPAALAAMEFGSGDKKAALKDFAKVTDPRYRDVRYVKEGRLWPSKVVEALKGLIEEAKNTPAAAGKGVQKTAASGKGAAPVASKEAPVPVVSKEALVPVVSKEAPVVSQEAKPE
eukprot:CAMPEP_0173381210 /NCGR_PEP_ID=MMETSP1356-20130122/3640_1 /TAXON_ID=77927 ORGANISM="Hemiselmis virescens, Strain PCC157" /NCGR_SAMPLE_ID=MMETSP1356 /ASSEMBLY_ACC=CAM_ASM_000847 /LENGTH=430 /DNA_ID=CAMNT_0014334969 /DNA_START=19 /DNA_END=1311 /DNA_ORIENTATION=-